MNIHAVINLRSQLIDVKTKKDTISYGGKDNATIRGKYYKTNLALFVNRLIYPQLNK